MRSQLFSPLLTEKDEAESSEGGLWPLGLYSIADVLGGRLVPGLRERQAHPRFLTAIAVSLAVCSEFDEETIGTDGISEPWIVFEWYLVEGLVRSSPSSDYVGLPGSLKAAQALADGVPLSAKRYLKNPAIFGFHAVYRVLARVLGIEQGGRLGETGYELLSAWAKEQGLDGFIGTTAGRGQEFRRKLAEAIRDGLKKGSTARSAGWSGWDFFKQHLSIYGTGVHEARAITAALLDDSVGFRREVIESLVSDEGRKIWVNEVSERQLHQTLRRHSPDGLLTLVDAIDAYETFARLCQDAFDDCLVEMTRKRGKTSPRELAQLSSVKLASARVPEIFGEVMERLEPFGETVRLHDLFGTLTERGSEVDWVERLLQHHIKTQRLKPPHGKNPWFERFDDGSFIIRPLYRRDAPGRHDMSYVHSYRTPSLWSFVHDLQLVKP
jgi:hypothetical protein